MIPIYRAKTIKQDYNEWEECEQLKRIDGIWYAIGFYDCKREIKTYLGDWEITHLILIRKSTAISEISTAEMIDITTLSIHFPDMIDSQGNKIFASLQEDGKGGDVLLFCEVEQITGTAVYEMASIFINGGCSEYLSEILQRKDENFKIIGIKE